MIIQKSDISSCIYCILNLDTGKMYFGQTKDFSKRASQHRNSLTRGNHKNVHLQRCFQKKQSLYIFVVEECSTDKLNDRESFWIIFHNATDHRFGYNMTLGGDFSPLLFTEESKKRKSESRKGISGSLKGRSQSKEWIEARVSKSRGRKRSYSEDHLNNIRLAMKARKGTIKSGIFITMKDSEGNVQSFDSIRRAAKYLNIEERAFNNKFYKGRKKILQRSITVGVYNIERRNNVI